MTLIGADWMSRDSDGFLTAPQERLSTAGFAITSEQLQLHVDGSLDRVPDDVIGDVRLSLVGDDGDDLFVGVAPSTEVATYLAGVQHAVVTGLEDGDPVYRSTNGAAPQAPPTEQDFWVARADGTDPQLTWPLEEGSWTVVIMNRDGSAAVSADVAAGAEVPVLHTVVAVALVTAAALLLLGAVLVAVPIRSASRKRLS
jgi:hypothetical protein